MAKGRRRNNQPRHDFIANAQIQRRVKTVVRQAHGCGQCNHIAREQRQLHPRLALGYAVAHGRHAARHLHSHPRCRRCAANKIGIGFKRAMRREHIVIGRNNPQIRHTPRRKRVFLPFHRRIGMGLIATR